MNRTLLMRQINMAVEGWLRAQENGDIVRRDRWNAVMMLRVRIFNSLSAE